MKHHTKDKADIAVAKIISDLVGQGFGVAIPLSEHQPFDLLAYDEINVYKVQVKHKKLYHGGVLVDFKTSWADKHGNHINTYDLGNLYFAIYCPSVGIAYYKPIIGTKAVSLRIDHTRKCINTTKYFSDYATFVPITEAAF